MRKMVTRAAVLEDFNMGQAFEVQRDLWKHDSVEVVANRYGVMPSDVDAVLRIQRSQRRQLPSGIDVSVLLPWILDDDSVTNDKVAALFTKSLVRLRMQKFQRRDWLGLPPAIHARGMMLANAYRLLSVLPVDAMKGGTIRVTAAPLELVAEPDQCVMRVGRVLGSLVGNDIQVDPQIRASRGDFQVLVTKRDVDAALNYAAGAMAAAIVAVTHHRAVSWINAGIHADDSGEKST